MRIDKSTEFSDAQALTASAASTNVLDLLAAGDAVNELRLFVQVSTVLDSAGEAATLTVALQTDSDSAFGSPTTLFTTSAIAEATLAAGYKIIDGLRLPAGCERYLRVYYTVGTENFTSGNVDAFLAIHRQSNTANV